MFIWQTKEWGDMLLHSNQVDSIYIIEGIKIEKRKVALGEYGFFILGLSSLEEFNNHKSNILYKLLDLAKKENVLFIQIETLNYLDLSLLNLKNKYFKEGYYKKFITPYTAVIDFNKSNEEILKEMKPKGRYNIKLAIKKGIEVKEVEKSDENIQVYYNLMLETTSRDNFNGNSFEYYKYFLNSLKNSKLLLAYIDGIAISGGIFIFTKKISIYYYGVSSSDKKYRNLMAPYLLQWEAIKIAKSNGSILYDFLGVSSPNEIKSSLEGVTNFKNKFTGDIRQVSNSYIWVNKTIKYNLLLFIRYMKKKLKK